MVGEIRDFLGKLEFWNAISWYLEAQCQKGSVITKIPVPIVGLFDAPRPFLHRLPWCDATAHLVLQVAAARAYQSTPATSPSAIRSQDAPRY